MILSSKKGNTSIEVIWLLLVLFIILVSGFAGKMLVDDLNTDIQADPESHNITKTTMDSFSTRYPTIMDNAFILVLVLVWALILVASYFIETHPIFFIFTAILVVFVLIIAAQLGNTYEEFLGEAEFTDFNQAFPKAHFIMSHIVLVFLLMSASVLVVLFAKR